MNLQANFFATPYLAQIDKYVLDPNQRFGQQPDAHEFKVVEGFDLRRLDDDWYFVHALQAAGYLKLNLADETAALETALLGYQQQLQKLTNYRSALAEDEDSGAKLAALGKDTVRYLRQHQMVPEAKLEPFKTKVQSGLAQLAQLKQQQELAQQDSAQQDSNQQLLEDLKHHQAQLAKLHQELLAFITRAYAERSQDLARVSKLLATYQAPVADNLAQVFSALADFFANKPRWAWFVNLELEPAAKLEAQPQLASASPLVSLQRQDLEQLNQKLAALKRYQDLPENDPVLNFVNRQVSHHLLQRRIAKELADAIANEPTGTIKVEDTWVLVAEGNLVLDPTWRYKVNYLLGCLSKKADYDRQALLDANTGVKEIRGHKLTTNKAEVFVDSSVFRPFGEGFARLVVLDLLSQHQDVGAQATLLDMTPRQFKHLLLEQEPQALYQAGKTFRELVALSSQQTYSPCYLLKASEVKLGQEQDFTAQIYTWATQQGNYALASLFVERELYVPVGTYDEEPVVAVVNQDQDQPDQSQDLSQDCLSKDNTSKDNNSQTSASWANGLAADNSQSDPELATDLTLSFPIELTPLALAAGKRAHLAHGIATTATAADMQAILAQALNSVVIDYTREKVTVGAYDYFHAYPAVVLGQTSRPTTNLDYWGFKLSEQELVALVGTTNATSEQLASSWFKHPVSVGFECRWGMGVAVEEKLAYVVACVRQRQKLQATAKALAEVFAQNPTPAYASFSTELTQLAHTLAQANQPKQQAKATWLTEFAAFTRLHQLKQAILDFANDKLAQSHDWLVLTHWEVELTPNSQQCLNELFTRLIYADGTHAALDSTSELANPAQAVFSVADADALTLYSANLLASTANDSNLHYQVTPETLGLLTKPLLLIRHDFAQALSSALQASDTLAKIASLSLEPCLPSTLTGSDLARLNPVAKVHKVDKVTQASTDEFTQLGQLEHAELVELLNFKPLSTAERLVLIWQRLEEIANLDFTELLTNLGKPILLEKFAESLGGAEVELFSAQSEHASVYASLNADDHDSEPASQLPHWRHQLVGELAELVSGLDTAKTEDELGNHANRAARKFAPVADPQATALAASEPPSQAKSQAKSTSKSRPKSRPKAKPKSANLQPSTPKPSTPQATKTKSAKSKSSHPVPMA